MALTKTGIDYLTHVWNFYTGCKHDKAVCPVADKCWARGMSHRFGRSFEPTLHPEKLLDPLSLRKPTRIGVCFTGDLFGDWVNPNEAIEGWQAQGFGVLGTATIKEAVFESITRCPQHQFFLLTKAPQNYNKWGAFPDNTYVGATGWDGESIYNAANYLGSVQAKYKWLSIEPLIGEPDGNYGQLKQAVGVVNWVVIGGWSGGKNVPKWEWVREIIIACRKAGIPIFLKDNLGMVAKDLDYKELP